MQVQDEFAEQANKIPEAQSSLAKTPGSGKKLAKRKGGLSMFLAGKPSFPLSPQWMSRLQSTEYAELAGLSPISIRVASSSLFIT